MFSTIAACALAVTLVQPHSSTPALGIATLPNLSNPSDPSNPSNSSSHSNHSPLFTTLYLSFATLQALDVHSTARAISSGAGRESNPALGGIASRPVTFIAIKAATTGATIWMTEKLRKKHRATAVGLMVALNSFVGVVVGHKYSVR